VDVSQNLDEHEVMIVNTDKSSEVVREKTGFPGKIFTVDASGISMEIIGQPRPNTVILGKIIQVTEISSLKAVMEKFSDIFLDKLGSGATKKNILAIERAYDSI
jgi:pyruvate ferredoxin oxidoreductase gamma subunit